jgi:5-methyltetrahydrofolate--homocysteine methyltransferase
MMEDMRGKDQLASAASVGLYEQLAEAVTTMKPALVAELARKVLEQGLSPQDAMTQGLAAGMRRMGEKFAAKECFVPEVLLASKAMYAGFDILSKAASYKPQAARARVALGVVQGDIHDIGKNIVKVMVQAAGFEVLDLGRNVPLPEFVKAAENGVAVLGISSLMTTTMPRMGKVVEALDKAGLRQKVKVIVGGAPVTEQFARNIGADGFAADAHAAVLEIERLVGQASR